MYDRQFSIQKSRLLFNDDDDDDDDDDDKLYLTTLTLSAEAGFHNGRVKKR